MGGLKWQKQNKFIKRKMFFLAKEKKFLQIFGDQEA